MRSSSAMEVSVGDLVIPASSGEKVCSTTAYRLLGVSLGGRGAFHRETKLGTEISAATLFKVTEGDLIYSRLFAWQGAFSLIDSELDGCYVSNEFPAFRIRTDRVHPRFLLWWLYQRETLRKVEADCTGSTPLTRNRYKEQFFLKLRIPLPSLHVQHEIVSRVESVLRTVEESTRFANEVSSDFDRLLIAMAHRDDLTDDERKARGWRLVRLGEVMCLDLDPVTVDSLLRYKTAGCYSYARGLFHKEPVSGLEYQSPLLYRMKAGQFTYLKLKAFEGSFAFVSDDFDGCCVSNEYPMFTMDSSKARAEWLFAHFKAPRTWAELASSSKGIGARRERVNPSAMLDHEVWLPPMAEQNKIAEVLRAKREYDLLDTFEKDAEALRRSILAKAFRGEL